MKKIIIILLLVLSICVFGKTEAQYKPYLNLKSEANRNPNVNSLVFSGEMEENGKVANLYLLEVYKRGECCPVFSKNLDNFSIYDEIFTSTSNKDILNKIPEDSDESYVSY